MREDEMTHVKTQEKQKPYFQELRRGEKMRVREKSGLSSNLARTDAPGEHSMKSLAVGEMSTNQNAKIKKLLNIPQGHPFLYKFAVLHIKKNHKI